MLHSTTQPAAKAEATFLTRREALLNVIKGTVVAAFATPEMARAAPEDSAKAEATFIPENDYPYFGCELPDGH